MPSGGYLCCGLTIEIISFPKNLQKWMHVRRNVQKHIMSTRPLIVHVQIIKKIHARELDISTMLALTTRSIELKMFMSGTCTSCMQTYVYV